MSSVDPLQAIKDAEAKASDMIDNAKLEIDNKLKELELASEKLIASVEGDLASELKKIESAAVNDLIMKKEEISQQTEQEISELQSKTEGHKAEAINRVVNLIIN